MEYFMNIEITFQKPEELYVDNNYLGKKYLFNYTLRYLVQGPEYDKIESKKVIVSISNVSLKRWDYKDDTELFKVLFNYVFNFIEKKLVDNDLKEVETLPIEVKYEDKEKKYDPNKIDDFVNIPFQLELDDLKKRQKNFKYGF